MRFSKDFDYKQYRIAVIFPFRYSEDRPDSFDRIHRVFSEWQNKDEVKFYIIDSGSALEYAQKLENICKDYGVNYVYIDTSYEVFSIGKARDTGAIVAKADYVFFQDIDFLGYDGFYQDLLIEVEARELDKKNEDFLMIPTIYLTEEGSKQYINTDRKLRKSKFLQYVYEGNKEILANLAIGSSALLVNRLHYLAMGGHDEDFFGHGFEDFEFVHRLGSVNKYFSRPGFYYNDYRNWRTVDYSGFRSLFRLYGDMAAIKGISIFHMHHSNNKKSTYVTSNANNKKLLVDKMKAYDETKELPTVLPDFHSGNTLALGKEGGTFYKSIRQVLPQFGVIHYQSEHEFIDEEAFMEYLLENKIDRVLMPNPYGNPKRLSLYQICRKNRIPYIVQDRGALTDSVFFDSNGFNADSNSYDESYWNQPLSEEESKEVDRYIQAQYFDERSLEKQGYRLGGTRLAKKLNINPTEKVLFVPFQRPKDTVIRYFSGAVDSISEFAVFVENLKKILGPNWRILAKKHPLENAKPMVDVEFVENDVHIKDLIELSDAVLLINSGVGVESMMWYKPVLHVGDAFYSIEGVNKHVKTPEEAYEVLINLFEVDREKVKRFIHYLIKEFYSFGKVRSDLIKQEDGSLFNLTRHIDFYQINIPGQSARYYKVREESQVKVDAPLFDRYQKYLQVEKDKNNEKKETEIKKKDELKPRNNPVKSNIETKISNDKLKKAKNDSKSNGTSGKLNESTKSSNDSSKTNTGEKISDEASKKNEKKKPNNNVKKLQEENEKKSALAKKQESKIMWTSRQAVKLVVSPKKFIKQYKRWKSKKETMY